MSGSHHLCPQVQATIIGHRGGFAIAHPRALGLGHPAAGKAELRRRRAAPVRRHHRLRAAGDVRQADRPGGHHRHRRAGTHGGEVRRRLRLRRDGVHVEREQVRRSQRFRGEPRRVEQRLGGDQETRRQLRPPDQHRQREARLGRDDRHARAATAGCTSSAPCWNRSRSRRSRSSSQQRSVSGSPTGSPVAIETMLDFASRHNIAPQTEHFPMSKINEAFARLESGKARYRIVLDADF